jgi:hypothetical protein
MHAVCCNSIYRLISSLELPEMVLASSPLFTPCLSSPLFMQGACREDVRERLASHILSEHFEAVKVTAAVLKRLEACCQERGECIISSQHYKPLKGAWVPLA